MVWRLLPGVQLVRVLCSAGSQLARGKRPKVPLESRFVSDLLAAVCLERSAGTAAAAWYGMAASGTLLLMLACFSPLQTPLLPPLRALSEGVVLPEGDAGVSQPCRGGRDECGSSRAALKPEVPTSPVRRGKVVLPSRNPSEQYPPRSGAVSASSDVQCPPEVTLNAG